MKSYIKGYQLISIKTKQYEYSQVISLLSPIACTVVTAKNVTSYRPIPGGDKDCTEANRIPR